MNPESSENRPQDFLREAEDYVRTNPIPALLGAVAVGFALGLVARSLESRREPEPIRDALNEIRSMLGPLAKKTRQAYSDSSDAVREAVEHAVEAAKDFEMDRCVAPVTGWWKRLWS